MGIKDKKAMKAASEAMEEALAKFQTACGNDGSSCEIDWSNWDNYDYDKMSGSRPKEDVIESAGTLLSDVIGEMATLCSDEDYKEELATITKIAVTGKEDQDSMYVDFALDGTTLNLALNADAFGSWKNADLLKEVWD
ncbi:MAG TPA: hypothetical protein ENJ08_18255 [Gammaproteobacteria bacterium]|nr:hypothetical protein [Gammaproteobacteria bacterium]